jgi:hypothetical protein
MAVSTLAQQVVPDLAEIHLLEEVLAGLVGSEARKEQEVSKT